MKFSSNSLCNIFAEENKYENFRSIASSLVRGADIYEFDNDGREKRVSKAAANKAIQRVAMEVMHLSEEDLKSRKKRARAIKKYGVDFFEIIEEDIQFEVNKGFQAVEWFNDLVESRNVALGDAVEYVEDSDVLFVVADLSGDNHDITMQQLPKGQVYTVPVTAHGVKIGKDIDLILLGRVDYQKMVQTIAASFVQDTQMKVYNALTSAASKLPSGTDFVNTGKLSDTTKDAFDEVIDNVATANASDVIIVGTKVALKKITALADVNWVSDADKQSYSTLGRLGSYESTRLVEVPNRFKLDGTYDKIIADDKLYILPVTSDKFIKFTDEGETEIVEVTNKGDLQDDFETYEVQRRYGAGVILGRLFGVWTLTNT